MNELSCLCQRHLTPNVSGCSISLQWNRVPAPIEGEHKAFPFLHGFGNWVSSALNGNSACRFCPSCSFNRSTNRVSQVKVRRRRQKWTIPWNLLLSESRKTKRTSIRKTSGNYRKAWWLERGCALVSCHICLPQKRKVRKQTPSAPFYSASRKSS